MMIVALCRIVAYAPGINNRIGFCGSQNCADAAFRKSEAVRLNQAEVQRMADVRDRLVTNLYRLRDQGAIAPGIRIAAECGVERNVLKYNPMLKGSE